MNKPYVSLQPSECVIVQAASQIFSAYVISGHLTPKNEDELLRKAIGQAIRLAQITDDAVQADKEVD